jgi:hypothetical protein
MERDRDWIVKLDHYGSLEELEAEWREGDAWQHDPAVIAECVRTAETCDDVTTWLAAVQGHWREHPLYPELRDTLLARLGEAQAAQERQVAEWRERDRQRFTSLTWTDRQLGEFRLREIF